MVKKTKTWNKCRSVYAECGVWLFASLCPELKSQYEREPEGLDSPAPLAHATAVVRGCKPGSSSGGQGSPDSSRAAAQGGAPGARSRAMPPHSLLPIATERRLRHSPRAGRYLPPAATEPRLAAAAGSGQRAGQHSFIWGHTS